MIALRPPLERTTFNMSRDLEFFSEKELTAQIGHDREYWCLALVKELIDNALDACEGVGVAPEIEVTVMENAVTVTDNGPGVPPATIAASLDYSVRASDKSAYVSPTRGQMGNALMCVWAAPFVVDGEVGRVEVCTRGERHRIEVRLDRIAQKPHVVDTVEPDQNVRNGTSVTMHWPEAASLLDVQTGPDSYKSVALVNLIVEYVLSNPHARFTITTPSVDEDDPTPQITLWPATNPGWPKWTASKPTSAHWYSVERLRDLIAAYLSAGKGERTVREFVMEFDGLSGTAKQKRVLERSGLARCRLADLATDEGIDRKTVTRLLAVMQEESRPVKPATLGILGQDHLAKHLVESADVKADSLQYRRVVGAANGRPFVLEVAFGIRNTKTMQILTGVNWSATLGMPFRGLPRALDRADVDSYDPVLVLVHLVYPSPEFTDRGKGQLVNVEPIAEALRKSVAQVTKQWTAAKKRSGRERRVSQANTERLAKQYTPRPVTVKEAAYAVMVDAYAQASGNGQLNPNARQVMYAARPRILELTGKSELNDVYFTQTLLPDFQRDEPELTRDWVVYYDDRGHFKEPHTDALIGLGTRRVRDYIQGWDGPSDLQHLPPMDVRSVLRPPEDIATRGPRYCYSAVLFIEKEGFLDQLEQAGIDKRFDLALMSTKGVSTTAARELVERLSEQGIPVYVLHDFDKSGFTILRTLREDTRRYAFEAAPLVIDLGLRLDDIEAMNLQSEPVKYGGQEKNPRLDLAECGASEAEQSFLVQGRAHDGFHGQRVELNAMTAPQFIAWLEGKLQVHGVQKVVPDLASLTALYQRKAQTLAVMDELRRIAEQVEIPDVTVPDNITERVAAELVQNDTDDWQAALERIVREDQRKRRNDDETHT